MTNKKKNSKTDHKSPEPSPGFNLLIKNNRFYPGVGKEPPNNYKAAMILPDGYRGACHLHKEPMLFKTIDELQEHMRDVHMVWKG